MIKGHFVISSFSV